MSLTRKMPGVISMAVVLSSAPALAATAPLRRAPGPAGSVVIVEENAAVPLVSVVVASRSGSAEDPRGQEGLLNLAAELARRGAGGNDRAALDQALDQLGASLDVIVDPDAVRLVGQVLARNLEPFLDLLADIVLRPTMSAAEMARTRREVLAQIAESRNDDRTLCARFFERRLFGDHPYGRAPDGTSKSLARLTRGQMTDRFRAAFTGRNLVFAAAGAVTLDGFGASITRRFADLSPGDDRRTRSIAAPRSHQGWRIQLVDKPDRQQTQIMFGQAGLPVTHPDHLALSVALATFGGRGMKSTLMDEVRTKRGLAYGAYMNAVARRGPGPLQGWVFTSEARAVTTLKLVLRLFKQLGSKGVAPDRLRFFQGFLAGSYASDMDDQARRLWARVSAELAGLPPDHVDTYVDRVKALTPVQVDAAIAAHLRPEHLAITLVATADRLVPRLIKSGVEEGAIDVVPFDAY